MFKKLNGNITVLTHESDSAAPSDEIMYAQKTISEIIDNIETVIIGKREAAELAVMVLISGGHVLIEDIPGVGKTTLVNALAQSVDCGFKRIQFTPDTMPSDISGYSIYNQKNGEFEFREGAVMSNIILADEINRAPAKTQASLLEIMEENQTTVDSVTYKMKNPFMVLATQNPSEYLGTYPLPEAQIDRFAIRISLGYPSAEDEMKIITGTKAAKASLKAVATPESIIKVKETAQIVHADKSVIKYIVSLISATRNNPNLAQGSSPRGGIALYSLCQVFALYNGRSYIIPDDVKYLAPYVLAHRVILSHDAKTQNKSKEQIIKEIISDTAIPF